MKIIDKDETYSILYYNDLEINKLQEILDDLSPYVDGYQFTPQFKAGVWDGRKYFYNIIKQGEIAIPKGLAYTIAEKFNIEHEKIEYDFKVSAKEFIDFIKSLNLPFKPYDYQVKGAFEMINDKRGVFLFATGAGKSLILYLVLRFLHSKGFKSMLIVPSVGLVEQMYQDFKDYGFNDIDSEVSKIYAETDKDFSKPIVISTWQSMIKYLDKVKHFDAILIDEVHLLSDIDKSISKIAKSLTNAKWKLGVTGSIPDNNIVRMSLYAVLGNLKVRVRPIDLINMGRATPVEIVMVYMIRKMKKMSYQAEMKFIEEDLKRNRFIMKLVNKKQGNRLVLYERIKHGELLVKLIAQEKLGFESLEDVHFEVNLTPRKYENLKKKYPNKQILYCYGNVPEAINLTEYGIYFIKGEVKGTERQKISKLIENKDDIVLIANYATTSTGVNIKKLHYLFLASPTKSFVRVTQSIGRGMRLHESKDKITVYDFVDDFSYIRGNRRVNENYSLQHSYVRLNDVYHFNGYPVFEKEVILD